MSERKALIITLVNSVLLIAVILFLFFDKLKTDKEIVSVNKAELFESFQMTKESQGFGEKEFSNKKKILDSLYLRLQGDLQDSEKEVLMKDFIAKREEFDEFSQNFALQESDKIWSRLKTYAEEFAKEHNYKVILETEDDYNGNVLYSESEIDVTKELIVFVNKRYSGL